MDGADPWESSNLRHLLMSLVGYEFGPEPETRLPEIRSQRLHVARRMLKDTRARKSDVAVEIGSGCGFMSRGVAPAVDKLRCCDISRSYLEFARQECADLDNVSFHAIESGQLSFIAESSIDLVFAHAVFIHLHLLDIYRYFEELARVCRPGARVWFEIKDGEKLRLPDPLFQLMARLYAEHPKLRPELMHWNSRSAVDEIARYFGFVPLRGRLLRWLMAPAVWALTYVRR